MLRPAAMLRPLVVSALITAGLCSVAHADVYRWVDDKGEPHYSDRWVPGSELIKSNRPHPMSADSSSSPQDQGKATNTAAAQSAPDKLAQKANADAVKQDVAKTREAQCKAAKQHYQEAIDARRIYKSPQPGDTDRQYMNDAETDSYRQTMRNDVTQSCGSPPPAANGGSSPSSSSYPTASRPQRDPEAPSERPE
jgi:Domain of unknown function (DUF4124)